MVTLDSENPQRHIVLAEHAAQLKHADLATKSYLRAAQLTLAAGALDEALEYFGRANQLSPQDRIGALLYAEAKVRKGDSEGAVALLEPLAGAETSTSYLALDGEALLRTGRLDPAREIFEKYYQQKPEGFTKLFELASAYIGSGREPKAVALLQQTKETMRGLRKEAELTSNFERLAATYPSSLPVAEVVAKLYEELNRETKYFDALVKLFDLYLAANRLKEACDSLDRLVDIDPYDYRNHERISQLEGKVDPGFLQNIMRARRKRQLFRRARMVLPGRAESRRKAPHRYQRKSGRSMRSKTWWSRWKFSCNTHCRVRPSNVWSASPSFSPGKKTETKGYAHSTNGQIGGPRVPVISAHRKQWPLLQPQKRLLLRRHNNSSPIRRVQLRRKGRLRRKRIATWQRLQKLID